MSKKNKSRKLWSLMEHADASIGRFTVGKDSALDLLLAPHDIIGSIAHGTMLEAVKILSKQEWHKLKPELVRLYHDARSGTFTIDEGVEDVHSQVELILTERLGEAAKKIHTGRSRNDQVLLDIRLFTREEIRAVVTQIKTLFDVLIRLAAKYEDDLMPGYTHFQIAMPSSFGLWFSAFAESLVDDLIQIRAAYDIVNRNPLGSAAGYGSSFPVNRRMTTDLLGFDDLNYNSIYAQMGRGRTERIVTQALASLAETVGRLAMDIVLFLSQNFAFISFPEWITTGSSIMPHKKNPDVFELVRARCNMVKSVPQTIQSVYSNLPTGYHRDLQLIKEPYLRSFEDIKACLDILSHTLPEISVRRDLLDDARYNSVFSVEKVNEKVLDGQSFRDAYHDVASDVKSGVFRRPVGVFYTHEGSIGNLCLDAIQNNMKKVVEPFSFSKIDTMYKKLLEE